MDLDRSDDWMTKLTTVCHIDFKVGPKFPNVNETIVFLLLCMAEFSHVAETIEQAHVEILATSLSSGQKHKSFQFQSDSLVLKAVALLPQD